MGITMGKNVTNDAPVKQSNNQPFAEYYQKFGVTKNIEGLELNIIPDDFSNDALIEFYSIIFSSLRPIPRSTVPASLFNSCLRETRRYQLPTESVLDISLFDPTLRRIFNEYKFIRPSITINGPAIAKPIDQGGQWILSNSNEYSKACIALFKLMSSKGLGDSRTLSDPWLCQPAAQIALFDPSLTFDEEVTYYNPGLSNFFQRLFSSRIIDGSVEDGLVRLKSHSSPGPITYDYRKYWDDVIRRESIQNDSNAGNTEKVPQRDVGGYPASSSRALNPHKSDSGQFDRLFEKNDLLYRAMIGELSKKDINHLADEVVTDLIINKKFKEVIRSNFLSPKNFLHPGLRYLVKGDKYSIKALGAEMAISKQMLALRRISQTGGIKGILSIKDPKSKVEQVTSLIDDYVLSVASLGHRFNSLDDVINTEDVLKGQPPLTKERGYNIVSATGEVSVGVIDTKLFSEMISSITPNRMGIARDRIVFNHSHLTQVPSHVLASLMSWFKRPESNNGLIFLSNQSTCLDMWEKFLEIHDSFDTAFRDIKFITGDISHAESLATSNFQQILNNFPKEIRTQIELSCSSVQLIPNPTLLTGLSSGQAFTTLNNVIQGCHLMLFFLNRIFASENGEDRILSDFLKRLNDRFFVPVWRFGGFDVPICFFLPTDDQPMAISIPKNITAKLSRAIDDFNIRYQAWHADFSLVDELDSFGMTLKGRNLSESSRSNAYKFIYHEHPIGNTFENERSMALRYHKLPVSLKSDVRKVMMEELGIDPDLYRLSAAFDPVANVFFSADDFGLNENKPSEAHLLSELNKVGSLLDPDFNSKVKVLDEDLTREWITFWKSMLVG